MSKNKIGNPVQDVSINKILKHYNETSDKQLEVPEWDMTIYYTAMTLKDNGKLLKYVNSHEFAARALMLKALDENGDKLFTLEHKQDLVERSNGSVMSRVVNVIVANKTAEEIEEN